MNIWTNIPLKQDPGNGAKNLIQQKDCKPKCRLCQVIKLGKSEVDPQGIVKGINSDILDKNKGDGY